MNVTVRDSKAARILYSQDLGSELNELECSAAQAVTIALALRETGKWIGHLSGRVIEFRREGY